MSEGFHGMTPKWKIEGDRFRAAAAKLDEDIEAFANAALDTDLRSALITLARLWCLRAGVEGLLSGDDYTAAHASLAKARFILESTPPTTRRSP